MRKTEKRCASCAYHAVDHQTGVDGCAYILITGHSRLKEAYQRLTSTPSPRRCTRS